MNATVNVRVNPRLRELHQLAELDVPAVEAAVRAIDNVFRRQQREAFDTEGTSNTGKKWEPWSESYQKFRDRLHAQVKAIQKEERAAVLRRGNGPTRPVKKILQLTGDMMRAFSTKGGDHIADARKIGGKWTCRFGARSGYARYHEEGKPPLPVRSILARDNAQVTALFSAATKALVPFVMRKAKILERLSKFRAGYVSGRGA